MRIMANSWPFLILVWIAILNAQSFASPPHTSTSHEATNHCNNHSAEGSSSEGHHDGIRLASFRWSEYHSIIYFTFTIFVASIVKIAFHKSPKIASLFPESCLLILLGVVMGLIIRFGLPDEIKRFPGFTSDLFFHVLLPPIILDAAYSIYEVI